jgi:hypothetical protein
MSAAGKRKKETKFLQEKSTTLEHKEAAPLAGE